MLRYDDLPTLIGGTTKELARAKIVRSACLRTIQNTQRQLLHEVGLKRKSVQTYHRQTQALRLTLALYTHTSWWLRPYPKIEQELRLTFSRVMQARYRLVQGTYRFVFPQETYAFVQLLAPIAPDLIYFSMPCPHCGIPLVRPALAPIWEPSCCTCCMPTSLIAEPAPIKRPVPMPMPIGSGTFALEAWVR